MYVGSRSWTANHYRGQNDSYIFGIDNSILNHPWLPGKYKTQVAGHSSQVQVTALCILRLVCPISILFIIIMYFFIGVLNWLSYLLYS